MHGLQVGQLRGSYVYSLERYAMIRVCSRSRAGADEVRFKSLVEKNLDLTKEFYFRCVDGYMTEAGSTGG